MKQWTPRILAVSDETDLDELPTLNIGSGFLQTQNTKKQTSQQRKSRLRGRPTKRGLKPKNNTHIRIYIED